MKKIELLAPAKGYDAVCAAVDHGADAVYMGASKFGARSAATNSLQDIVRSVEYAHMYGVRLYATLNTLLFEDELAAAEAAARDVVAAGVDALIVQDMAYTRMGLDVELHSSTQMCNMTPRGVKFLEEVGFSRVVLERNLSLSDISQISQQCDVELEAFVHGAICVGYSGRCFLSRSTTGRSGNRGECSQPCRLPYDLRSACDGVESRGEVVVASKHLLSVRDMDLSQRIGEMLDCGVSSFKIEGRLKELSYNRNIVAYYRRELDRAMACREGFCRSSVGETFCEFTPNPRRSFSRGETQYMFDGKMWRDVASLDSPKSRGEFVGCVVSRRADRFALAEGVSLATGDGLCFMTSDGLVGGSVNSVSVERGQQWVTLNRTALPAVGVEVFRNFDRVFEAAVLNSRSRRTVAVEGELESSPNIVRVKYRDEEGYEAESCAEGEFEMAKSRKKMDDVIRRQLERCGDTIFSCKKTTLKLWGGEFVASSQLAQLRREALAELLKRREEGARSRTRAIFRENMSACYPDRVVGEEVCVTNSLAKAFYRDHGVEEIAPPLELAQDFSGKRVLESNYCIRRQFGECLKSGSKLAGPLYIERGGDRFRLKFDCDACRMSLIKV